MPAPQNNQGFVNPSSGGTGNWLGKLFGGIGEASRARSMAQIQLDLHGERAKIDTEHFKERQTHKSVVDAAAKDYLGERGLSREKRRARFYKKEGVNLADVQSSSATGIAIQKKGLENRGSSENSADTSETTTGSISSSGGTPPKDRANDPSRRPAIRIADEPQQDLPTTPSASVTAPKVKKPRAPRAPRAPKVGM